MSGFKGKPGPWHWEGKVLCNDEHIVGGDGWAFNDADKRLIAAATELLEALQEMVAIVKKHTYPQPDKPSSTWGRMEAAEAVIAKALGNN